VHFGSRIRLARLQSGLSISDLSLIEEAFYSIERGTCGPTAGELSRLSIALDRHAAWFFADPDEEAGSLAVADPEDQRILERLLASFADIRLRED